MIHPIRTFRNTVEAIQLLLLALRLAVETNTAATAALQDTAEATLAAAKDASAATAYLAAAEKHSREQAGQRHDF